MSLTKATFSMIEGAVSNVLDFGADPTGTVSSLAAFNAALLPGGSVYVPEGTYILDGKVEMYTNNTTLFLGANVTLTVSGVVAQQSPWGSQIDITGNNCAIIGSGSSSLIQNDGSYSNMITFRHQVGAYCGNLRIDGDKANVTPTADDSFGNAVFFLASADQGVTSDQQGIIENCIITNMTQYGVIQYGNQSNGVKIIGNTIRDIGNANPLSVGAGISISQAVSDVTIIGNTIKNCKQHGMFITSAGNDGANYTIVGNLCHQNTQHGIAFNEQATYGSVSGKGLFNIAVSGNVCSGNTQDGINFNADTVGYLAYISITGNTCEGNGIYGIRVATTNTAPDGYIDGVTISGNNCLQNGTKDIFVNPYVTTVEGYQASFTPAARGTTTAGTGTYTNQNGSYIRNGNLVTFEINLAWTNHTGTGDIEITGFPFAAAGVEPLPTGWVWANGLTITGQATFSILGSQTYGALGAINNGTYSAVAMDTSVSLRINGFYFTDL